MDDNGFSVAGLLVYCVLLGLLFGGIWRTFEKAGEPGWKSIVPVYNFVIMLKIAGRPLWFILLLFIPLVNLYVLGSTYLGISRSFGKDVGFAIGMVVLPMIFWPILGLGKSAYVGGPSAPPPMPTYPDQNVSGAP